MKAQLARAILIAALAAWSAAAQETAGAGAFQRPLAVPPDYVITPFGYFHPSCVRLVKEGETVLEDERIQHADGSVDPTAPVCNYPRFAPDGSLVSQENTRPGTPPATSGWVEYISAATSTSFGKLTASWTTPPQPATSDGQLLYFFPGFEDTVGGQCILQPVLQYGAGAAGGGNYWTVANWNVCGQNLVNHSLLITVNAGDAIVGSISSNCKPGGNSCPTWNVTAEDKNTGAKTVLAKTPNDGQVWNWAFASVMEAYNVFQCADYPANKAVSFDVNVYDQNLQLIATPGWTTAPAGTGITPYCGFGLSSVGARNTVAYNPKAPTSINVTGVWDDSYQMTWTLAQAQKSNTITGSVDIGPEFACQDATWPVTGKVTSGTSQFTITATNPVNGSDGCYLWYTYTLNMTSTMGASGTWSTSSGSTGTVSLTMVSARPLSHN